MQWPCIVPPLRGSLLIVRQSGTYTSFTTIRYNLRYTVANQFMIFNSGQSEYLHFNELLHLDVFQQKLCIGGIFTNSIILEKLGKVYHLEGEIVPYRFDILSWRFEVPIDVRKQYDLSAGTALDLEV